MASIIKIGKKWRAQVRRRGFGVYTRSFATKTLAAAWAAGIEADIARGLAPSAQHVAERRHAALYRNRRHLCGDPIQAVASVIPTQPTD